LSVCCANKLPSLSSLTKLWVKSDDVYSNWNWPGGILSPNNLDGIEITEGPLIAVEAENCEKNRDCDKEVCKKLSNLGPVVIPTFLLNVGFAPGTKLWDGKLSPTDEVKKFE